MHLIQWCGIALILSVLLCVLHRLRPELAPMLSASGGILFFLAALAVLTPFLSYLKQLGAQTGIQSEVSLLLKLFALCALLQWACGVCRELGETTVAEHLSLLGKAELLCLCLPQLQELIALATGLLS